MTVFTQTVHAYQQRGRRRGEEGVVAPPLFKKGGGHSPLTFAHFIPYLY